MSSFLAGERPRSWSLYVAILLRLIPSHARGKLPVKRSRESKFFPSHPSQNVSACRREVGKGLVRKNSWDKLPSLPPVGSGTDASSDTRTSFFSLGSWAPSSSLPQRNQQECAKCLDERTGGHVRIQCGIVWTMSFRVFFPVSDWSISQKSMSLEPSCAHKQCPSSLGRCGSRLSMKSRECCS